MKNCIICGSKIPWRHVINGVVKKVNDRTKCFSCSPFRIKGRRLTCHYDNEGKVIEKRCSSCKTFLPIHLFYKKANKTLHYRCKACSIKHSTDSGQKRRHVLKQMCVDYLGGKCQLCGYNKCNKALDFHHRDPRLKDFEIAQSALKFSTLKKELDKCVLLCSNCHRETHAGLHKFD